MVQTLGVDILEDWDGMGLVESAIYVPDDGQADVSENGEDEDNGKVHLEAVDVVVVQRAVEEADQEVVHDGEGPGGADGVVGADVCHDGDFGRQGDVGEEEVEEETCEGAFEDPVSERVED